MCFHLGFYKTNALEIWKRVQHGKKELSNVVLAFGSQSSEEFGAGTQ